MLEIDTDKLPEGFSGAQYPVYPDLQDVVAFVTGGATGIGAFLVNAFARQGAKVAFVSLQSDPGEALAEAVASVAPRPLFLPCDVRDVAMLQAAIAETERTLGGIGVLINNAARDDRHRLDDLTVAEWNDLLDINLRPQFFAIQAVAAGMRQRGSGTIINLGSNSALLGLAGYPAYAAAKAGIQGLTRTLARELGPAGIRINTLIPGWVMTERQKALWATPEAIADCLDQQCLKRSITGDDIAQTALFLASSVSAMMTGQSIVIDGGRFLS